MHYLRGMNINTNQEYFVRLLQKEVKPALGCTEPIAVALAAARAKEVLEACSGESVQKVKVEVSANILKNGMGVGIPGTGMMGLHIATALSISCGKSRYGLEVLKDLDAGAIALAKQWVEDKKVDVELADTGKLLYIRATCFSAQHQAACVIQDAHDQVTEISYNGQTLQQQEDLQARAGAEGQEKKALPGVSMASIYEFATTAPLEAVAFMEEAETMNRALAREGMRSAYGLKVGQTLLNPKLSSLFEPSLLTYAMALTAAASDARMGGCTLPAMSNSGSGNQGIAVTMPVAAAAERLNVDREKRIRALVLSHLTAIHIKSYLGRLSALCGCVVAGTGAACGICYLMGGGLEDINASIKNMVGNLTGMVCDGAKAGCALKVATGASSAVQAAALAMAGSCVSSDDGIVEADIEDTIRNLGRIGAEGMPPTDKLMLDIMVQKRR